jgi:hypothetical protein
VARPPVVGLEHSRELSFSSRSLGMQHTHSEHSITILKKSEYSTKITGQIRGKWANTEHWGRVRQKMADKPDPYSSANGILCPCLKIFNYLSSPFTFLFVAGSTPH